MSAEETIQQLEDDRKNPKPTPARLAYWKSLIGKKQSQERRERQSKMAKEKGYGKWMKGRKLSEETKRKISENHFWRGKKTPASFLKGEKHFSWKGDEVGYGGLHVWVRNHLGKPSTCEHCGRSGLSGKFIGWANKSNKYLRDLTDWIRLCRKCHYKYDKGNPKAWKNKMQRV